MTTLVKCRMCGAEFDWADEDDDGRMVYLDVGRWCPLCGDCVTEILYAEARRLEGME